MTKTVQEVMTRDVVTVQSDWTVADAARLMLEHDVGDVVVLGEDGMCGIVTDRDITVRAVAHGRDPAATKVSDVSSGDLVALSPTETIDEALRLMRSKSVHRLPVVEKGRPIGMVSLGDLAVERDPGSPLADISAAGPNR